ncbi:MAG: polymerase sigma factor, sigma-70 family [Frankiales bacterium]|jgi:RNA polymerase sigma-70 factor (ECF subfamily)|nr:polymerase sigma factor, sigma-70 family [Frankiales bacterium]
MDELEEWLAREYARAYRTACLVLRNPDDAEDAVQEAFLRVWRFRDAIPSGAGRTAWLYRVVVNACVSRIRSESARTGKDDGADALSGLPDRSPEPAVLAERTQLAGTVAAALADLPEHLRVPLVLRFYAGLSEKEIATAIDRRPGTVKSRLHEARQRLAQDLRLGGWVRTDDDVLEASR